MKSKYTTRPRGESYKGYGGDTDALSFKYHVARQHKVELPTAIVHEAVALVASRNLYHPVKEYLESLTWDGVSRIDTWLSTYCQVLSTDYTDSVGAKVLIGALARIYQPGCKFDYTLVLEGSQGIGKSTVCALLGKGWYGSPSLDITNKDTVDQIRSKWIVELAEMETASRAETQALKAFLTRQTDRVRMAYARNAQEFPRTCIFIGTINPDKANGYLKDTTGNRRFWPVFCTGAIAFDDLAKDVDQLWAEAKVRYECGEDKLYLDSDNLATEASDAVNERVTSDPWEPIITHWLDSELDPETNLRIERVTVAEIYEHCLHGSLVKLNKLDQMRISRILIDHGFSLGRVTYNGVRSRGYIRET